VRAHIRQRQERFAVFLFDMALFAEQFPACDEAHTTRRGSRRLRAALMALGLSAGAAALVASPYAIPAQAQDAPKRSIKTMDGKEVDIDEARKLFKEHQQKLKEAQQEQKDVEAETKALDKERVALQTKLLAVAQKAQDAERRLTKLEDDIEQLAQREKAVRKDLEASRATIAQMLAVMQRMGHEPPPIIVTERHDALKMVRSAMVLSSFFPTFKGKADKLAAQIVELDDVLRKSRAERQKYADAQVEAARAKTELDGLISQKREKMQKNIARAEELRSSASKHARVVTDVGSLLQKLDGDTVQFVNIADYEKELKQLDSDHVIKPEEKTAAFVQPGRIKPAIPFDKAKGMLKLPCQGKRLVTFGGHDSDAGTKSEGIRVETRTDAQVVAPADGWVIYAGQFRSYGQLLIINAGGGYHILLAGMDQIYTTVGQFVLAGEPVAAMGKPLAQPGTSEIRKPVLYIEFRKDAHPVDPGPWWSAEGVKEG
jgi:murein hydrolase activator